MKIYLSLGILFVGMMMAAAGDEVVQASTKSFGERSPFKTEDLPAGQLKTGLGTLNPQAKDRAMKWLHRLNFGEADATQHMRVDKDGGVFIVCPDQSGDGAAGKGPGQAAGNPPVGKASVPVSSPPAYHSKPGATRLIYLDYNGGVVSGKAWNTSRGVASWNCYAWSLDGDYTTFSDAEQAEMRRAWERISEDYAPFDVDVTTDVNYDPDKYTGDKNKVGWLMFTETIDRNGKACPHNGYGGIAYVGVYGDSDYASTYQPAWVAPYGAADGCEAGSHEMGHNMGLSHDGTSSQSYYGGHAATASAPSWGPIMGTGYNRDVSQWSKGEYFNANLFEDDLAVISSRVPYRADDYGNAFSGAAVLSFTNNTISKGGIIGATNDRDVFTFSAGTGPVVFSANPYRCDTDTWGGNLDIVLELYDASQNFVASSNPAAETNASISMSLTAGNYYLVVRPTGCGSPQVSSPSGYTVYGSLGKYTLTGTVVPIGNLDLTAPNGGETLQAGTNYNITWNSSLGGNVRLELLKNGLLDSTIVSSTPNTGSYDWFVPVGQMDGTTYRVRITSVEYASKTDTSGFDFTINSQPTLASALDTTGITWNSSGNLVWYPQSTVTHDFVDAAQSGLIGPNQSSTLETTLRGPGTLTFWWKVSSEFSFDLLKFSLNGIEQTGDLAPISGEVDWVQKTVFIPVGNTLVNWTYAKDATFSIGSDAAWVDQVVFTPSLIPEITVEQPVGVDLPDGGTRDFGNAVLGSAATLDFTIGNLGYVDLTGLGITIDGANASDFTVSLSPSSPVIPSGTSTFTVRFAPSGTGTRTAVLHIANNDGDENPFDITLTGTGLAPDIVVQQPPGTGIPDGGEQTYGNVALGSTSNMTFTILNTGTSDLTGLWITKSGTHATEFSIVSNPTAPVAPGGSTTFTVAFTPVNLGDHNALIQIGSNDPDTNLFDISLKGFGTAPEIGVEHPVGTALTDGAAFVHFGSRLVNSPATKTITIRNSGLAPLKNLVTSKSGLNPGSFSVGQPKVAVLAPGASTTFDVKFFPTSTGFRTASIQIASDDPDENPFDITLTGTGANPEIAVRSPSGTDLSDGQSTVNLGKVPLGNSVTKRFTIKNTGSAWLSGISVGRSGVNVSNFTVTRTPAASLAPGASTSFAITFKPSSTGNRSAKIHIASTDKDENPFDISLTGIGTAPEIAVKSPFGTDLTDGSSSVGLGSPKVGSAVTRIFTISNKGKAWLKNLKITKDGSNPSDFTITQPKSSNLAPGASMTFSVTFTPKAKDKRTAAIHIANNDKNENPFDITLTGTGLAKSRSLAEALALQTTTTVEWDHGHKYLALEVHKPAEGLPPGTRVEVSSDLLDWFSGSRNTSVIRDDAELLKVRDNTPLSPGTKRFIRLK